MEWLSRLALAWRHIGRLSRCRRNPVYVEDMTPQWLASLGAQAIILDHDGVLGPNGSEGPDETGGMLVRNAVKVFGPGLVFILSNTHTRREARREHYEEWFKEAIYLTAKRKPDPDGVSQASWACGAPMERIAVVDDGLLTGILMAVEAGAIPVYGIRRRMDESILAMVIRLITTAPQIVTVWVISIFSFGKR